MKKPNPMLHTTPAHHTHAHALSRRRFLGATAASLGGLSLPALMSASAQAQATDFRALVCIFLYGGNDGFNSIVPNDSARYNQYNSVRQYLAIPQGNLSGLANTNYGLHPGLAPLQEAWNNGQLATLFNVGPLFAPLTQDEFLNQRKTIPESLFSHSDQQTLWECSSHLSLSTTGWGGRAAEQRGATVISVGGNGRFGISTNSVALVLPSGPGSSFGLDDWSWYDSAKAKRQAAINALHNDGSAGVMEAVYSGMQNKAFSVSQALSATLEIEPGGNNAPADIQTLNTAFGNLAGDMNTDLAKQLYQIAKLIVQRSAIPNSIATNRHIYFAQLGGFDTHDSQIVTGSPLEGQHARLLATLGSAMAAFNKAMNDVGLGGNVTTFTQSDFGRTFQPNTSNGSDHGWGNNHFIMGAAVQGGTYGTYPALELGGPDDSGVNNWDSQGRWIPTVSVDQYAATLLRWWGLGNDQLGAVLPNLNNFGSTNLGFMRT
jgi:uncharacterized protein (DUF1501 family)